MNSKKKKWGTNIITISYVMIGVVCGILIMRYMDMTGVMDRSLPMTIVTFLLMLVAMYVAIMIELIIHESGHLIFGLLTGYKFSSFRIFQFMWVKENDRIRFRKMSLAGTGGQCLMSPPDPVDGKYPALLYNLGGVIMNILTGILFLGLSFLCGNTLFLKTFFLFLTVSGLLMALQNGLPLQTEMAPNDGSNAREVARDPEALRAFWVQMKVNDQISRGIRTKDMPEEWFAFPTDEAMKSSLVASLGVFACNRLMDVHHFAEADEKMKHLLSIESGLVGLHRGALVCDRMFVELVVNGDPEAARLLMTKEQETFMKAMVTNPSVIRTEYVVALLDEKDSEKAQKILERFELAGKKYPYPSEIEAERELIEMAKEKAAE